MRRVYSAETSIRWWQKVKNYCALSTPLFDKLRWWFGKLLERVEGGGGRERVWQSKITVPAPIELLAPSRLVHKQSIITVLAGTGFFFFMFPLLQTCIMEFTRQKALFKLTFFCSEAFDPTLPKVTSFLRNPNLQVKLYLPSMTAASGLIPAARFGSYRAVDELIVCSSLQPFILKNQLFLFITERGILDTYTRELRNGGREWMYLKWSAITSSPVHFLSRKPLREFNITGFFWTPNSFWYTISILSLGDKV